MTLRFSGLGASVVPSSPVKAPSLAARLAALLALMAHALAIVALCACSMAAPAGPVSSCHDQAEGLTISSLDGCCCESGAGEARNRDYTMSLSPDATSFQAAATSIASLPTPVTGAETRPRLGSRQGSTTPRPPLRV